MDYRKAFHVLKDAAREWSDDKVPTLGAALAYYTLFSLAPLLLIAIGIAGLIFGPEAARGGIVHEIEGTVGTAAAEAIQRILENMELSGGGTKLTLVGIITLLFGATGTFNQLQESLNIIWKTEAPPRSGILAAVRERLLSVAAVLSTGFLLLVSLVLSSVLSALGEWLTPDEMVGAAWLWQAVNFLVSLGLITLLFALIFKWLPDAPVAWRDVWGGAVLTALLFSVGKYLIGFYLAHNSMASASGAAGSLVVILVWVYFSSQIVLYGAEVTHSYATLYGSLRGTAAAAKSPGANGQPSAAVNGAPARDQAVPH